MLIHWGGIPIRTQSIPIESPLDPNWIPMKSPWSPEKSHPPIPQSQEKISNSSSPSLSFPHSRRLRSFVCWSPRITLARWGPGLFSHGAGDGGLRERMACAVRGQGPESILIGSLPELDEGNGQWKNVNLPNQSNETPRVWGPCKGDPDFLWPSLCFRKLFWDIATGTDNMTCSSFQSASGDDTWEYNQKRMCKMSMDWSCWKNLSWKPT